MLLYSICDGEVLFSINNARSSKSIRSPIYYTYLVSLWNINE